MQISRYPARVYDGDALVTNRGAAVVVDSVLRVAALDGRSVVVVLERAGVASIEPHISRKLLVHFVDGTSVTISRGDGCSCSNPLKRWYVEQRGTPARSGLQ